MHIHISVDVLSAEILEASAKPSDTMSLQKAKHIFAQCMNKGKRVATLPKVIITHVS